MSDRTESQVFRYRPAWQKWAFALILMVGFTWYHLSFGYGSWVTEEPLGPLNAAYLAMIVLFIGGLGVLPAWTLYQLSVKGHVTVADEGLRWRTWWGEKALGWDEVEAVGEPLEEKGWRWIRHFWFDHDRNIRIITVDGWRDIPCGLLPDAGDTVFEAIAGTGGLTESFERDSRGYRSRPDWSEDALAERHPWRRLSR